MERLGCAESTDDQSHVEGKLGESVLEEFREHRVKLLCVCIQIFCCNRVGKTGGHETALVKANGETPKSSPLYSCFFLLPHPSPLTHTLTAPDQPLGTQGVKHCSRPNPSFDRWRHWPLLECCDLLKVTLSEWGGAPSPLPVFFVSWFFLE